MGGERPCPDRPFMLQPAASRSGANLPESALLSKRPASDARGVLPGLTDFADITVPGLSFSLSGPSATHAAEHLPVRGDLAHIRLAGKIFVPNYVVPMAQVIDDAGAVLRKAGKADAEALAELAGGTPFNLLDTSGGWAWGQVGDDGAVGYVPADVLRPAA